MAEAQSLVDQGVDRVQDVLKNADKEFQKIQRQVKSQRRTIERRIETRRKNLEKTAQKQFKSFEKTAQKQIDTIRQNDLVKRIESFGSDVQEQVEAGVEQFLSVLQIASKSDIQRVDRKLNRISKKLKELESPTRA